MVDIDGFSTIEFLSNRECPNQTIKTDPVPRSNAYSTRSSSSSSSILQFCLILAYFPYFEQEVPGRTNWLLSIDTTRIA